MKSVIIRGPIPDLFRIQRLPDFLEESLTSPTLILGIETIVTIVHHWLSASPFTTTAISSASNNPVSCCHHSPPRSAGLESAPLRQLVLLPSPQPLVSQRIDRFTWPLPLVPLFHQEPSRRISSAPFVTREISHLDEQSTAKHTRSPSPSTPVVRPKVPPSKREPTESDFWHPHVCRRNSSSLQRRR